MPTTIGVNGEHDRGARLVDENATTKSTCHVTSYTANGPGWRHRSTLSLMGADKDLFKLIRKRLAVSILSFKDGARLRESDGREQGQRVRGDGAGLGRHDVRGPDGESHVSPMLTKRR